MCVFCDSFLCSISLLLLSAFLSCILNSVLHTYVIVHIHVHYVFFVYVLQCCVKKFHQWINVAPLQPKRLEDEGSYLQDEGPYARVLACAYSPDRFVQCTCACVCNMYGFCTV